MNKFLTKAALGLTLGATALTAAAPAEAQRWNRYRDRDNGGVALAAGIAGLAIGAALASNNDPYRRGWYDDRGYAWDYDDRFYRQRGYYPNDGYYAYRYRDYAQCRTERRWDPYYGRRVRVRVCY